jgi:hypothetical protein
LVGCAKGEKNIFTEITIILKSSVSNKSLFYYDNKQSTSIDFNLLWCIYGKQLFLTWTIVAFSRVEIPDHLYILYTTK